MTNREKKRKLIDLAEKVVEIGYTDAQKYTNILSTFKLMAPLFKTELSMVVHLTELITWSTQDHHINRTSSYANNITKLSREEKKEVFKKLVHIEKELLELIKEN